MKKKKETVEEFVARGGVIKKYDYISPEEETFVIKETSHGLPHLMSLSEGELFFTKKATRAKKERTKEDMLNKLDKAKLPEDILNRLKTSLGNAYDKASGK
jgi:hypothetical protein